jgi:hypothetical protein
MLVNLCVFRKLHAVKTPFIVNGTNYTVRTEE